MYDDDYIICKTTWITFLTVDVRMLKEPTLQCTIHIGVCLDGGDEKCANYSYMYLHHSIDHVSYPHRVVPPTM